MAEEEAAEVEAVNDGGSGYALMTDAWPTCVKVNTIILITMVNVNVSTIIIINMVKVSTIILVAALNLFILFGLRLEERILFCPACDDFHQRLSDLRLYGITCQLAPIDLIHQIDGCLVLMCC